MYHAKSGRQWSLAFIALALSAFGLIPLKQISDWLSGGPIPGGSAFFGAAVTLFFLAATILFISNALRGLPRLTVTPDGIKFESGIWTKCATWDAIGPFAVKVHSTSAKVAGAAPRRSRRRARTFTIPNQFTVPIGVIATDLNVARALATGETPRALKELQAKELQAKELQAKETSLGLAQFKVPWLTLSILFVLIAIFTLENMLAVSPGGRGLTPSIATLIAFGASSHKLVVSNGEWYRLFTGPLLHANPPHILGNGIALLWGGWLLERLVGRLWFFAFFSIGALGGSLVSIAVNPINLVSVGASGALMGLFAALFVGSFRYPSGTAARTRLLLNSLRILVPSLLPFLQTSSVGRIDYGAHIGGTLSGAILALALLKCWPEGARIPQFRKAAAGSAAIGALLFMASSGLAIVNYPKFVQALQHAKSAAPSPPSDVLSDHGPKRAACDFKWGTLHLQDFDYPTFLQKCMTDNSTSP